MRFYRGSVCRAVLMAAFLMFLIVIPVTSSADGTETLKPERRAVKIDAQFGEPGHDPFLREWEPGGDTWRNREGEPFETLTLPGAGGGGNGNGGGQQAAPQTILKVVGDVVVRIIDTLF